MIKRKLNKRKGFKGFKVVIDKFALKELAKLAVIDIDEIFDDEDKKEIEKAYKFYKDFTNDNK